MKLSENNKEIIKITKYGNFKYKRNVFVYGGLCKNCGEPYLSRKCAGTISSFCCYSCANSGKYNPAFGKLHSKESRIKQSKSITGSKNHMYNKHHSKESKQKMSDANLGKKASAETKQKMSDSHIKLQIGKNNPGWKGGTIENNIPLYDTYADRLKQRMKIGFIIENGVKILTVKCHNSSCKNMFVPKRTRVWNNIQSFNGTNGGECNLYCSDECKDGCQTYRQRIRPKGIKTYKNNRPGQSQWRRMVLKRDNHTCQICGFYSPDGKGLIAHHIDPVINNPIESMDIDIGITLCVPCDTKVHQLPGCRRHELRCKKP